MRPEQGRAQESAGLPATPFHERLAAAAPQDQALYRVLLRALADGAAPTLAAAAGDAGLSDAQARAALGRLVDAELVAVDANGELLGVFPVSAVPSRHTVRLRDGRELHAMCAVDALGVPAMLNQCGVVLSSDPSTGQPVTITLTDGRAEADPPGAVVLLARAGTGSLASACCSVIAFYADGDGARSALEAGGLDGLVLQIPDAVTLGAALFGQLPAGLPEPGADLEEAP